MAFYLNGNQPYLVLSYERKLKKVNCLTLKIIDDNLISKGWRFIKILYLIVCKSPPSPLAQQPPKFLHQ